MFDNYPGAGMDVLAIPMSAAAAAELVSNGSASDNTSAANDNEEQARPNGGADCNVSNNDVRMSPLLGGRRPRQQQRLVSWSSRWSVRLNDPPLPNLPDLDSESGSSGLPLSATRMSDTFDKEDLIQPDETFAADNKQADRGKHKPCSFLPGSVPSSSRNGGDDETVCTTEDILDSQDADGGRDDNNENTAGGNGASKARIEELEAENYAKDERMKA
ncbi:hypothetical protein THAOC_01181, partial [Thalassiosira oceanica]